MNFVVTAEFDHSPNKAYTTKTDETTIHWAELQEGYIISVGYVDVVNGIEVFIPSKGTISKAKRLQKELGK